MVKKRQRIKNSIKQIRRGQSDDKSIENSMSSLEESDASGKESMHQMDCEMLGTEEPKGNQPQLNVGAQNNE